MKRRVLRLLGCQYKHDWLVQFGESKYERREGYHDDGEYMKALLLREHGEMLRGVLGHVPVGCKTTTAAGHPCADLAYSKSLRMLGIRNSYASHGFKLLIS